MDIDKMLGRIGELTAEELTLVQDQLLEDFKTADEATDVTKMQSIANNIKTVRGQVIKLSLVVPEPEPKEEAPAATETKEEAPAAPAAPAAEEVTPAPAPAPAAAPVVPAGSEPVMAAASGTRVYAGADIPGYTAGYEFTSGEEFGKALAKRINTVMSLRGGDGEKVVIASLERETAPERTLNSGDPFKNWQKIEEVTHPDAIIAAGGCCAPLVTKYDLFDCGGVTDRPVKDALAGFRAERGGIRFFKGPALADVNGALGFWTCADDAAASVEDSLTWKVCARIDCPPEQTAELQAITLCLTFGVLQTRIFPEVAVANNKLALVAQARLGDAALLAQIKVGSTLVTDAGTPLGATRDILDVLNRASMYFRDRYRINKNVPLRAVLPFWILNVLRGDLIKAPFEGQSPAEFFGISDDQVQTFFSDAGINVTWALDSAVPATYGGGFYPAITGAALPAWPTSVQWALFPEGTWLFLDGGQLDLGVIRDSSLVRVNDYMTFSESWEAAVNIGCESLWITSAIDVTGKAQGPIVG